MEEKEEGDGTDEKGEERERRRNWVMEGIGKVEERERKRKMMMVIRKGKRGGGEGIR